MNKLSGQRSDYRAICAIAALLAALVVAANVWLIPVSTIANADELRLELAGTRAEFLSPTWIDDWFWRQEAPFKYRILGKLPVWAAYEAQQGLNADQDTAIYRSFTLCCFISLFLALTAMGAFTRTFASDLFGPLPGRTRIGLAALSMCLMVCSAPVLLFSKFAVHGSPNDFIGYALMLTGLHLAWVNRIPAACAVAVLAVFCRETTLLVPFALLFFFNVPLWKRLAAAALPVAAFIAFRTLWPGKYDPASGASLNFEIPWQTLAFFFLAFGPLWILGPLGYRYLRRVEAAGVSPQFKGLTASFPFAAALTFAVVLLFARVREIRILFVLSVYILPFSVAWLYGCRAQIRSVVKSRYFLLWILAAAVAAFRLRVWLLPATVPEYQKLEALLGAMFIGFFGDPHLNWVLVLIGYLFVFLLCLPFTVLFQRGLDPEIQSATPAANRITTSPTDS